MADRPVEQPTCMCLMGLAESLVAVSEGRLRLARNEADATLGHEPEAASFLKLDGTRLGRDVELYGFMGESVLGWPETLTEIAQGWVLPLRSPVPSAYRIGAATLVEMGRAVYAAGMQEAWADIFADEAGAPVP